MGWIVKALGAAGGLIAGLIGGFDTSLRVLLILMGLDYLSALILGFMGKSPNSQGGILDSKVGLAGLFRKMLILMMIIVAAQVDIGLGEGQQVARGAVAGFYIANEALSVLENVALAGVPLPRRLLTALGQGAEKV